MPLSKEGQIATSHHQRESDRDFLNRYGHDKLREKLESEGVYAYGFADEEARQKAVDVLFALSDECKWGDNVEPKEKYVNKLNSHGIFSFNFWSSSIPESGKVLVVNKPFPKVHYDERLNTAGLAFREIPVYRLADLTEKQIIGLTGGGLWNSYCYIDLSETVKKP